MKSKLSLAGYTQSYIKIFFTNKKGCKGKYDELIKEKMNLLRKKESQLHLYINGLKEALFLTTKT